MPAPQVGHCTCVSLSPGTEGASCRAECSSEQGDYASHSGCREKTAALPLSRGWTHAGPLDRLLQKWQVLLSLDVNPFGAGKGPKLLVV